MMNRLICHLKSEKITHIMRIQTILIKSSIDFFYRNNVPCILPVILSTETDPLQNDVLEAHISYYGQKLHLMKSMIIQKQLSLSNRNIDSLYTISPCIRLERNELYTPGRHIIEFQQIDFEFKQKKKDFIMTFTENLLQHMLGSVKKECANELAFFNREITVPETPFPRYDNIECIRNMGKDYECIMSKQEKNFFWVTNFKRWIYDRYDKKTDTNLNYDIISPEGFIEIGSGGERENEYDVLVEKIRQKNMDISNHKVYLELIRENIIPESAGIGLGVQRLLRYITGETDIDEVSLFYRKPNEIIL